jgi:hypothetical protein
LDLCCVAIGLLCGSCVSSVGPSCTLLETLSGGELEANGEFSVRKEARNLLGLKPASLCSAMNEMTFRCITTELLRVNKEYMGEFGPTVTLKVREDKWDYNTRGAVNK